MCADTDSTVTTQHYPCYYYYSDGQKVGATRGSLTNEQTHGRNVALPHGGVVLTDAAAETTPGNASFRDVSRAPVTMGNDPVSTNVESRQSQSRRDQRSRGPRGQGTGRRQAWPTCEQTVRVPHKQHLKYAKCRKCTSRPYASRTFIVSHFSAGLQHMRHTTSKTRVRQPSVLPAGSGRPQAVSS